MWVLKAANQKGLLLLPIAKGYNEQHISTDEDRRGCHEMRDFIKPDMTYNQAYYQSLAVWYVMEHCDAALDLDFKTIVLLPELKFLSEQATERARYTEDRISTPKGDILRWFRFRCLEKMCQRLSKTTSVSWDGLAALEKDFHDSKAACEKLVLRLREGIQQPDAIMDEEVDRLYLLGDELFDFPKLAEGVRPTDLAQARARQSQSKLQRRRPTSQFNPGLKPGIDVLRSPSHAPWELTLLNQSSALSVALWSNGLRDLIERRDNVFEFILSDHTFMSTWDRADSCMVGKWWDIEPVSVLCSTLIDLKSRGESCYSLASY